MAPSIALEGISIVLLGKLNPAIFHPSWFGSQSLVRPQEADAAEIELIHRDVSVFAMQWVQVQVTHARFQATTTQPAYYPALRDLVVGTFRTLEHTPIGKMGINRDLHYRLESEAMWHDIGNKLAPKSLWNSILKDPGMRALTIEGRRPDKHSGFVRTQVAPSTKVHPGLYVNVNDHYEIADEQPKGCREIIKILEQEAEGSIERAKTIGDAVAANGGAR